MLQVMAWVIVGTEEKVERKICVGFRFEFAGRR
jgi:hypothetical protein